MSDSVKINGNCLITNFDTRDTERTVKESDVIIRVKNDQINFDNKFNFNQVQVIEEIGKIATLDGKEDLSIDDIIKAKQMLHNNKFVAILMNVLNIKVDQKAKVGTIEYKDGQKIRINFNVQEAKGNFEDFSLALANRESNNNYRVENKYHYLGKYQMGELALEDIGLYKRNPKSKRLNSWNGTWTEKAKQLGIKSKKDFLNNSYVQEYANREYKQKQWNAIKSYGLDKYIGKKIKGCELTASGLLAGAHLKGVKGLKRFLEGDPNFKSTDGFGTDILSYINRFKAYDISVIIGLNKEYLV